MRLNLPDKWRKAIYVINILTAPVMAYLSALGVIGEAEMTLYLAEVAAMSGLAAINTNTGGEQ